VLAGLKQPAGPCGNASQNGSTYSGYHTPAAQPIDGVRATIISRPTTLSCTGSTVPDSNFSTDWVMITGTSNTTGFAGAYSQVGEININHSGGNTLVACYFAEYNQYGTANGYVDAWQCSNVTYGQGIQYEEFYDSSCGCERSIAAIVLLQSTPFNPLSEFAPNSVGAVYSGESDWVNTNG
jgi:hypothetical protein